MEKIDPKSIIKGLQKDEPKVIPNPKEKTISVTYDFGASGYIKSVKIIASREKWLNWHWMESVSYEDIKDYLSRPSKKVKKALEDLYKQSPVIFNADFFNCVLYANAEANPDFKTRVRARKPSRYNLTWHEKNKISNISIRLYDYLYNISKQKEIDRPNYLKKFLKAYEIKKYDIEERIFIEDVVRKVMSKYCKKDFGERFWQTFVTDRPISIKQVRKIAPNPNPEKDEYLKELFKDFI